MGVTTKTLKEERERLIVRERMSKEEKKIDQEINEYKK